MRSRQQAQRRRLLGALALLAGLAVSSVFLRGYLAGPQRPGEAAALQTLPADVPSLVAGAADLSETALRDPRVAEDVASRAARLAQVPDRVQSEAALRDALAQKPDSAALRFLYGSYLSLLGRYDRALEELEEAQGLSPMTPRLPLAIGLTAFSMGDRKAAEAAFRRALALDPAAADAYLGLAYIYNTPARRPEAIDCVRRFNELRPQSADGRILLARLYLDGGDPARAAAEGQAAVRARPDEATGWYVLGLAQSASGDEAEAARSFAKSVELAPHFTPGRYELGRRHLQAGRAPDAVRELQEATRLWPGNGDYHWTLMLALRAAGDREGAAREERLAQRLQVYRREQKRLGQRIQDDPADLTYYEQLARLHVTHRRPERAVKVLRDALARSPESPRLEGMLREVEQSLARPAR